MNVKNRSRLRTESKAARTPNGKKANRKGTLKKRKLFNPDEISTRISQAIHRDLGDLLQEYEANLGPGAAQAVYRQKEELLRKYLPLDHDKDRLESEAFAKFRKVNDYMSRINVGLIEQLPDKDLRFQRSNRSYLVKVHLRARALVNQVLGHCWEDELIECTKHSGGSSIGVPFQDTSLEAKSTYPLSTTARAKRLFERYLTFDPRLKVAMDEFNRGDRSYTGRMYQIVDGSRATTVEKDGTKRRFIAVEPTVNMFMQQGLMAMMYKRLKAVGLDVESLPESHKIRAMESSITCREATIDWASASDSVAYELVKWILPHDWFYYLDAVRCPETTIRGERVSLSMFSSMGNAATFPLETLIFWAYAHAVRMTREDALHSTFPEWEDFLVCSVFGDDCIVPSNMALDYIQVMELVGFNVNSEKSYYGSEQFRESCGGDFAAGYPVRPFNLKAPSDTRRSSMEPWLYIIMNSLLKKYILYFGELKYVYGKALWELLAEVFRQYNLKLRVVPPFYPDDAGLQMSQDIERFAYAWGFDLTPLYLGEFDNVSFSYLRFVYRCRLGRTEALHYVDWLRKPSTTCIFSPPDYTLDRRPRENGGYVVARAATPTWGWTDWMSELASKRAL
jgi:hypothetical protein